MNTAVARDHDPASSSMITIIGPMGPKEEVREYKIGERVNVLGLSAIVGDPRLGLCFDGRMTIPLWKEVHNIICELIDEARDHKQHGDAVDPKHAMGIKRLEEELKRIPECDFVAEVFVLVDYVDGWKRCDILGEKYEIFFGIPYAEDVKTSNYFFSMSVQLAKPRDVIEKLKRVGPETLSHGLFKIGLRGEHGTCFDSGYREDWKPLVEAAPEARRKVQKRKRQLSIKSEH
jgi:hypothetical protein